MKGYRGVRVPEWKIPAPSNSQLATQNFFRASSPNEGMPRTLLDK
jgi:hypothetical protein